MPLPLTALSTWQKFFPYGFGRPFKGHPCPTKYSGGLYGTLMTGGFTPKCSTTTSLTKVFSTIKHSSTPLTPSLQQPSPPDFSPLLSWKWHDFPSGFCIWQPQFGSWPISPSEECGRKDVDVHTKAGCDVIDLTNEDSSSDDKEL